MSSLPDLTTARSHRWPTARRVLVTGAVAMVAMALGCGGTDDADTAAATDEPTAAVTRTTTVTVTTSPADTGDTTDTDTARPTADAPAGARPTVVDLERELAVQVEQQFPEVGPGEVRCDAEGALADWQPVLCHFFADDPAEFDGIHVSMLDGARYAWTLAPCCGAAPWPDDYPAGLHCRDLLKPPPDSGRPDSYHLSYGLAVYYWLSEGRPDRMDADRDGIPCETVHPAHEVAAFWDSVRVLDGAG